MINGKRYGAESCTIEPMMLTRPQVGTEPTVPLLVRASGNRLAMFSTSVGVPDPATDCILLSEYSSIQMVQAGHVSKEVTL
jgi:hypothetical protein